MMDKRPCMQLLTNIIIAGVNECKGSINCGYYYLNYLVGDDDERWR